MIEKARLGDPPKIQELVRHYANLALMLPRSLMSLYEHIRDFHVYRDGDKVLGCAALHVTWQGLAEIRSVAVAEEAKGQGIGRALVQSCMEEARVLGVRKLFVLTYVPDFFAGMGFELCDKDDLPHKVWADCVNCPHFPDCNEIAMTLELEAPAPPESME